MNLEQKEKLETITANLDSIIEILFALQLLDLHCQSELNALKISDFFRNANRIIDRNQKSNKGPVKGPFKLLFYNKKPRIYAGLKF